jgi:ATP-dependent DNA helicase DinG
MKKLDPELISAALRDGGLVARRLSPYEPRESQLELMELIIQAFNEDALAAAEAGTGVGKSFAYLLPAIHYALNTTEKIVISTATINLQQQLFEKDIPLVINALDADIKSVLMKGRGNYLCRRRLDEALREPGLDTAENDQLYRIADWAQRSKTGSRSELPFVALETVWLNICSEADLCPNQHCPEYKHCFVYLMRQDAASAHIIVVNHHLLFADLAARYRGAGYENAVILPPFTRLIVDEAHSIEHAATSFYSREFSRPGLLRQLGRLYHKKGRSRRGLLMRVSAMLPADVSTDAAAQALEKIKQSIVELDNFALELCAVEGVFRLSPDSVTGGMESSLFSLFGDLQNKIRAFAGIGRELLDLIPEKFHEYPAVWEMKALLGRFDDIAGICQAFVKFRKTPNEVMWMEKRQPPGSGRAREPYVIYTQTPVEIAENLKESLFEPNKTVVCVSATLTVNNSFDYWAGRCGFGLSRNRTLLSGCFPSPFPYARSVLLASPLDAPMPDESGYQEFVNHAAAELVASSGGSALILFTSYQSLQDACLTAVPRLQDLGIRCLKQGDDDRARLLQEFLNDETSVLFATDSFWEGVDAPGDTLRLVIICRLPFRTPNNPVFEARREALEKKGGNSFMELSLPEAVMKFKQGFGRLMRRSSDHGAVVVLDRRLIRKQYGIIFQHSLPETKTLFADLQTIVREMENFLFA